MKAVQTGFGSFGVVCALFLTAGCGGGDLDRASAKALLIEAQNEPIVRPLDLSESVFLANSPLDRATGDFSPSDKAFIETARARLELMKKAGLITYTEEQVRRRLFSTRLGNVAFSITPTDKLARLIESRNLDLAMVRVGHVVIDEVTGVAETGENRRQVDYTVKKELNEAADYLYEDHSRVGAARSATFVKYDDGWRLSSRQRRF